jgi:hypothetical protein
MADALAGNELAANAFAMQQDFRAEPGRLRARPLISCRPLIVFSEVVSVHGE